MRANIWKPFIGILALAALVSPAFGKTITKIITIDGKETLAGKELKNDDYTFKVDDSKVVVELRHKVVAEATGHWEDRPAKYESDIVVTADNGQIQELRFGGEKRAFVIGGGK